MPKTLIGNIRGPQGLKGDKGDQGIQGIQGPPGPAPDSSGALNGQVWSFINGNAVWSYPPSGSGGIIGAPAEWPTAFNPSQHSHPATQISDSTDIGRALVQAADQQKAREIIGAGVPSTPFPGFGNTADKAAPGNHGHAASSIAFTPTATLPDNNVQAALERAATLGGGGSGGTASSAVMVVKYANGQYPALPATKPANVQWLVFKGPVHPNNGNVSGGIPAWVGDGATQVMADFHHRPLV